MRICILTPGALGSNPRVVKEAQALSTAGHSITVISTRTLDLVDRRDDDVLVSATWRSHRLNLRRRAAAWRLKRVLQMVSSQAFRLTGIESFADFGFSAFTGPINEAATRVQAELYLAHYPAALPAAARAARRYKALYAFDAEDFHLGDAPEGPGHHNARQMLRAIEDRYLPGCAYVTAASPGIADAYVDAYGIARPTVVLNVFPCDQAPKHPTPRGTAAPGPSVYWFSQTIGPERGLECAVRAIGLAQSRPHLYLRGTPAAGFLDRLRTIAAEVCAADRLHVLPPAAPSEMVRLAAVYDLGLVGEAGYTQNRGIALTNKQFTYLLAGIPAVMTGIPAHRDFVVDGEARGAVRLYPVDNPSGLATALDTLLGDAASLAAARAAAWQVGQKRFNWDIEQESLLGCVSAAFDLYARSKKRHSHTEAGTGI